MQSRIFLKCTSSLYYTRELQKVLKYLYKLKLYHQSSPLISFCERISIKTKKKAWRLHCHCLSSVKQNKTCPHFTAHFAAFTTNVFKTTSISFVMFDSTQQVQNRRKNCNKILYWPVTHTNVDSLNFCSNWTKLVDNLH